MMQQLQSSATSRIHHTHVLSLGKHSSIFLQCLLYISLVYIMHTTLFFFIITLVTSCNMGHGDTPEIMRVCVQMNACVYMCVCTHACINRVNVLYILCIYRTFRTGCNMKFQYLQQYRASNLKVKSTHRNYKPVHTIYIKNKHYVNK